MTNAFWNAASAARALWNASPDAMALTDAAGVVARGESSVLRPPRILADGLGWPEPGCHLPRSGTTLCNGALPSGLREPERPAHVPGGSSVAG